MMQENPKAGEPWVIRHGTPEDLAGICEIYNHYVHHSVATFDLHPWEVKEKRDWMAQFKREGRSQMFVAERAGQIIGYAYSGPFRERPAYDITAETTVYLAPGEGGQGLGRRLYGTLIPRLKALGLHRLIAGVTLPNPASVALHESFGFESVGVMSQVGIKMDRYWDVGWWQLRLKEIDV
ncbi:MAG: GNAT family N-acetyltransferase [Planctomycetota bacterium]|nr:GNAT family N-acetyltransferase [Planctomycetota bacterium]